MKKYLKYIGASAVMILPLVSCEDHLEVDNMSAGNSDGNSYLEKNPTKFRVVAFNEYKSIVTNINMQDQGGDLFINPSGADDGTYNMYIFTELDGGVSSWYGGLYKAINYANGSIHYNDASSVEAYEGRFLRDWGYYLLTQHFGSVPYVTKYVQTSSVEYPRTPLEEIYPSLIEDLTDLYNSSSLPVASTHDGIVSKQAVAALLAKTCLAAGWDLETSLNDALKGTYTVNGTSYFTQAAAWAEKAINGVNLTMSFAEKWSPKNEGNAEEIFSIQYQRAGFPGNVATGGHSLMYDYMGYYGNSVNNGQKGTKSGGTNSLSLKSVGLWEKGDQRFEATFMTTTYNSDKIDDVPVWGTQGYLAPFNCTEAELANLKIAYKFYPWYVTESEAKADLAKLKSQTVKYGDAKTVGVTTPGARILGQEQVTSWDFKADGSLATAKKTGTLEFMKATAEGNAPCVKKFDDPESANVNQSNCYRDIPVFHVSDMYLVAAEAYLLANNTGEALKKVNAVRQRAGLNALGSFGEYEAPYTTSITFVETPLDLILDERARELYAERTRWEDLRRTRQLIRYNVEFNRNIESASDMQNLKGEYKWYRPIPQTELDRNKALSAADQNPGY